MFKALTVVSSQITQTDGSFNTHGVEYDVWRKGIFQLNMMSEDMARRVYVKIDESMEGTLDWEEFLKGMEIINAKTKMQMIELFISLADIHHNGYLTFKELTELSAFSLKRYFSTKDRLFFESLVEYFARFIFKVCDTPLTEKLNLHTITDLIEKVGFVDAGASELSFDSNVLRGRLVVIDACVANNIIMSSVDSLTKAVDRVKHLKRFVEGQSVSKLVVVGSAVAFVVYAAYSFYRSGDCGTSQEEKKKDDKGKSQNREGSQRKAKKKFIPEKKFFTEEDLFSEDISTSNPHERHSQTNSGGRKKSHRFMSESDYQDIRSVQSKDIDSKVKEEADDLYFALMHKLKD